MQANKNKLSPCHITSIWSDDANEYRMHIFLNSSDETLHIDWHKKIDDSFIKTEPPEQLGLMVSIMKTAALPVISALNKHYESKDEECANLIGRGLTRRS